MDSMEERDWRNTMYCLSPECQLRECRVCERGDFHSRNPECEKWLICQEMFLTPRDLLFIHNQEGYLLNPQINSLQALLDLHSSKYQFQQRLKQILKEIECNFRRSLQTIETLLTIKIEQIISPIDKFHSLLEGFLNAAQSQPPNRITEKIEELLESQYLKLFLNQNPTQLLRRINIQSIEDRIRILSEQMIDLLVCPQAETNSDITIGKDDLKDLRAYLLEPHEDNNIKTKKFTIILQLDRKSFLFQKQSGNKKLSVTKCPLCPFTYKIQMRKRDRERQSQRRWAQLTDHLLNSHIQQVGYTYQHLISKKVNHEVHLGNINYLMNCYSYEELELIHFSARRFYNFHYSNCRKLQVQVLSAKETPQCNTRYSFIQNATDFIILFVLLATNIQAANQRNIKTKGKMKSLTLFIDKTTGDKLRKLCEQFDIACVRFVDSVYAPNEGFFQGSYRGNFALKQQEQEISSEQPYWES